MKRIVSSTLTLLVLAAACTEEADSPVSPDISPAVAPGARLLIEPNPSPDSWGPFADLDLTSLVRSSEAPGPLLSSHTSGTMEPSSFSATLAIGQTAAEHKTVGLPATPPTGDIVFSMDLTGSMGGELDNMKLNAVDIMNAVTGVIPNSQFGLVSYMDYPNFYTTPAGYAPDCVGSYADTYGLPFTGDYPYSMDQSVTATTLDVADAIDALALGSGFDGPESYARVLWETWNDESIGWRTGAKKIVVNFADNIPHDCRVDGILGDFTNTGADPGRDETVGTADDIRILDALGGMADDDITLINLWSGSEFSPNRDLWDAYVGITGGANFQINGDGTFPGGVDPADAIADLILAEVSTVSSLTLEPCGGYEAFGDWVQSVSPASIDDIALPAEGLEFDVTYTVPDGTPDGTYTFEMCAVGDGAEFASQTVTIEVVSTIEAEIDIKPNSDPSSWQCKNTKGSIPVAVLGSDGFDATTLDANTVLFGVTGTETGEVHVDKKSGEAKRHEEDFNGDGFTDMIFHFDFGETGFSCDDIPEGEKDVTLLGRLTGRTVDGRDVEGSSDIRLVGGKK